MRLLCGYSSERSSAQVWRAKLAHVEEHFEPKTKRRYSKKWGSVSPQRNRRNFLSAGRTDTCMYIASMSAESGYLFSRNRRMIPRRLASKSGPVKSMSLRQTPLYLARALETRRSFPGLFG